MAGRGIKEEVVFLAQLKVREVVIGTDNMKNLG